jgi:NAD+ kinase
VGFLTELQPDEVEAALPLYLNGDCWVDQRSLLCAIVNGSTTTAPMLALNDIVVVRGAEPRIIRLRVQINSEFYTNFTADGVIVATATGSTAYNLAAGGPILYPSVKGSVLTAISPHLVIDRPLVLDEDAVVHLELLDASNNVALLSADGQTTYPFPVGSSVTITHSECLANFVRRRPRNDFFRLLNQKLDGNG